jgi:hypothetical protein
MPLFETSRFIPQRIADFAPVAADVLNHFRAQEYEVASTQLLNGAWHISLSKGGMFKAVLGMKTALNIDIQPAPTGTLVKAGVGIFGQQAVPTAIAMFFFWPILIPQIWGIVQQSKLDDEAVNLIEARLAVHAAKPAPPTEPATNPSGQFCVECGKSVPAGSKFCPHCGAKMAYFPSPE